LNQNEVVDAFQGMVRNEIASIHTAAPGTIVSYDSATGLASVQPSLQFKVPDGRVLDMPVIIGVPVQWPSGMGGKASVTFPLQSGDSVLLVFAERALDDWLKGGESDDPRKFDLTDAFAIPCVWPGEATVGGAAYPDDVCLAYGDNSLRITSGGAINIAAAGGVSITGDVVVSGDLTAGGISLKSHVHSGVESGSSSTGSPVG
jgi:hypothetical protein